MFVEDAFAQFERTRSRQMCEHVCVMLADPLAKGVGRLIIRIYRYDTTPTRFKSAFA
jgi:hypothetical protein